MKGLQALKKGKFNTMQQVWQPDGSVIITLIDNKTDKVYKLRVRDLYGENEQEVDIATGEPITE